MHIGKPCSQNFPRMKITSSLFNVGLKCITKCFLRSQGETRAGNDYADWVMGQAESYRKEGIRRLLAGVTQNDCVIDSPGMGNLKASKWPLAMNLVVSTQNLESSLHAVERVQSQGGGKPTQLIPIRFVFSNKITRDDKVLMAFDALVLSEILGREISHGRIIHGDNHAKLKVRIFPLAKEVQKLILKIQAVLSSHSPPDLVLKRHCVECEFQCKA